MCRTMAILALIFALPFAVDAFDGQREGFLLSIGLGGGQRTIEESISPSEVPNIINPIKTTDLVTAYEMKISYGLSNSLMVGLNILMPPMGPTSLKYLKIRDQPRLSISRALD